MQTLLQSLTGLTRLVLERTAINNAGVEQLALLTGLRRLSLAHSDNATDGGLQQLTKLNLEWLDLSKCGQITTKGLRTLQGYTPPPPLLLPSEDVGVGNK